MLDRQDIRSIKEVFLDRGRRDREEVFDPPGPGGCEGLFG